MGGAFNIILKVFLPKALWDVQQEHGLCNICDKLLAVW